MENHMKQIAAIKLERFVALANLLDAVPAKDFSLRKWVQRMPRVQRTMLFGLMEIQPACGFVGCAMGWAAHEKIIPGLELYDNNLIYEENGQRALISWEAVMAAMGIVGNTKFAEYLFYSTSYKTDPPPARVAKRLRRFIRKIEAIRARDRRRALREDVTVQRKLELVA